MTLQDDTPEWYEYAACHHLRDLFFSSNKRSAETAIDVCHGCPVEEECLVYTLGHYTDIIYGTWCGLTEKKRHLIYQNKVTFNDWKFVDRDPDQCEHSRENGTLVPIQTERPLNLSFCLACRSTVKFR
jgi:hypothetical protein